MEEETHPQVEENEEKPAVVLPIVKAKKKVNSLADATQTKQKLNKLMNDFISFDDNMKVGTRQRREQDEHRLEKMRMDVTRLENRLLEEKKKRIEMNKSLQAYCDSEINKTTLEYKEMIENRTDMVKSRLATLADRITTLEEQFEIEKVKIPKEIEEKTAALTEQLNQFMKVFEAEKQRRFQREDALQGQLGAHENQVAETFDVERRDREIKYTELKSQLDNYTTVRCRGDEKFQDFVRKEVADIQNALVEESRAREREDDEIVEALNRYTTRLQDSLKIINSTDT